MRMHVLQHVAFEDLGAIEPWAVRKQISITKTCLWRNEMLPDPDEVDWLVILGGPMGVQDELAHPWLAQEKAFLREVIRRDRIVLGVCLGAQLIAEVLGAKVRKHACKEIGWFPVNLRDPGASLPPFNRLPKSFPAFHWHGDTFDVPEGALHAAESAACAAQAFTYKRRVVALQFHLECTWTSVEKMVEHGGGELLASPSVQSRGALWKDCDNLESTRRHLESLLDAMLRSAAAEGR